MHLNQINLSLADRTKMKIPLSLIIIFAVLSGCFFARVDWEDGRKSATVWTIGKSYYVEPNSVISESDNVSVITPWVGAEMGE